MLKSINQEETKGCVKKESSESGAVPPSSKVQSRRVWTSFAKLQVLKDIDLLKSHGEDIGAYLRQQGLFSSTVSLWRSLRNEGLLTYADKKRGPQPKRSPADKEVERLRKENIRLQKHLETYKKLIEIQKKIASLLNDEEMPQG